MESVLPCGMPWVMVWVCDLACYVCTDCILLVRYDSKYATVLALKLKSCLSLCSSVLCATVSYALDRSM